MLVFGGIIRQTAESKLLYFAEHFTFLHQRTEERFFSHQTKSIMVKLYLSLTSPIQCQLTTQVFFKLLGLPQKNR